MKASHSTTSTVLIACVWRVLVAALTRTFFQPDEFYQSIEVAHRAVFGYGHLTWEWTASPPIRSIFFPSLYIPVYWFLKVVGWDKSDALIVAPKVFQGMIAAITDTSTRELARQLLGERYANVAFVLSLTSFFHILALGRTLSNSMETSLTTAALCFWPWHAVGSYRRLQSAFALAAISCIIRPTSLIIWVFMFGELWWRSRKNASALSTLLTVTLITAVFASGFLLFIDSWYFGRLTFTPLNFALVNLSSVSLFYGHAPWHYYVTQGLPILLNISLPVFASGIWSILRRGLNRQKLLLALIVWTIAIYSLLGHKEWRFIHPLLPLMYVISAKSLVDLSYSQNASDDLRERPLWSRRSVFLLLGVLPGIYAMRVHGSAQINVLSYLRALDPSVLHSIGFLMPCHSTPWQAYLHRSELTEGLLWALGCEPPIHGENFAIYRDQTETFYASPLEYLKANFPQDVDPAFPPSPFASTVPGTAGPVLGRWDHRWPSHLIFFGALIAEEKEGNEIMQYLTRLGYGEVWIGGNGFEEDRRRRGGIKVWWWQRPGSAT